MGLAVADDMQDLPAPPPSTPLSGRIEPGHLYAGLGISNRFTLTYYENMCRFTLNLNHTKQW